ncbi:hypothetical protein AVEN_206813-1 [Araneus ventricosus]|uniref:Uncharacterized protein n=1 Tax=Araneus ventricosus TaxID=182803 RepID=A0A4Y2C5R5_ARAVE|nr:hypothetical protein AVEN_206813-1 [Araneus ventricosus]
MKEVAKNDTFGSLPSVLLLASIHFMRIFLGTKEPPVWRKERFHQDKGNERRHQERWNVTTMEDYCWVLSGTPIKMHRYENILEA